MNHDELPQFAASSYTSSSVGLDAMGGSSLGQANQARGLGAIPGAPAGAFAQMAPADAQRQAERRVNSLNFLQAQANPTMGSHHPSVAKEFPMPIVSPRRLVQVFVADTNDQVPLKDSVLYSGAQQLTDLTDQELFYELNIKEMLVEHNKKRAQIRDKHNKHEENVPLEPARVRDLKMVVVTIAQF